MSNTTLRAALATVLHTEHCGRDHTDQCAWCYEEDWPSPWTSPTHVAWMERADKVLAAHPGITLTDVLEVMAAEALIDTRLKEWRTE